MFRSKDISGNSKYITRSKAKVIDNRDPLKRGRIRVEHGLTGKTSWMEYLRTPGTFTVPSIGDLVYIEAEAGEIEYIIAWGNATKGLDESPAIPTRFQRDIPTNRGMYTPGGHFIEMDDGVAPLTGTPQDTNFSTTNRGIRVTSAANNKIHIIEDSTGGNQYILIEDAGGNLIKLDYENNQLTVNSIGKTKIDTAEDKDETVGGNETQGVTGNKTDTIGGNKTEDISGNLTINVGGPVNLTAGGTVTVTAPQVHLNGSASGITTENSHLGVIDLITGVPVIPSTTVKSDI